MSAAQKKKLFRVYVDEAGDRGWGGRSSPVFVLAAVVVPDEADKRTRLVLDAINGELGREPKNVFHWADNVKTHPQRKFVSQQLALTEATIITVVVHKECLMGTGTGLQDATSQYNYAVRRLLERISWYVSRRRGEAILTFAHVRRFPYQELEDYLELLKALPTTIKWNAIRGRPRIEQPTKIRLLQMADLVAGSVFAAVRPDRFGDYESAYVESLAPRIWKGPTNKLDTYGIHFIGAKDCDCPRTFPWWSTVEAAA